MIQLMEKQQLLDVRISPQFVVNAIEHVLQEEIKEGVLNDRTTSLNAPKVVVHVERKMFFLGKRKDKTR